MLKKRHALHCPRCDQVKPREGFYFKSNGTRQTYCRVCQISYQTARQIARRKRPAGGLTRCCSQCRSTKPLDSAHFPRYDTAARMHKPYCLDCAPSVNVKGGRPRKDK